MMLRAAVFKFLTMHSTYIVNTFA